MNSYARIDAEQDADRTRGITLWRQIDEQLSADIGSGVWQAGERLPTEQVLAGRFDVNRHTIRRAIQAMVQRGLLRVEQGRGTFVQEGTIDYLVGRNARFSEMLAGRGDEPSATLLRAADVLPPVGIARQLRIHPRSPAVMIERLSATGGIPVSLATTYFPAGRFSGLDKVFAETRSLRDSLKRYGVESFTRSITRITARLPTAEEARILKQPANRPVLQSEAVDVDEDLRPIAAVVTRFASDRVQIVVDSAEEAA